MDAQLDPAVADALKKLPLFADTQGKSDALRGVLRAIYEARAHIEPPFVTSVSDEGVTGADGVLRTRVYRPSTGKSPTIVYFHGGGWVAGDLQTHDRVARFLALETDSVVVSVDYRRPPEARFPAAFDDALAVVRYVLAQIDDYGRDQRAVAVAGDSAGGNLAAASAIACRAEGIALAGQLLIYPIADLAGLYADAHENDRYPSRAENAENFFLTLQVMQWFARLYLTDADSAIDWRASPMRAKALNGLAPAVVCTAQFDPLRDEGEAYARALARAGVETKVHHGAGLIHGYFGMAAAVPAAQSEAQRVCADFKSILHRAR
jgi:acetyl esterase